MATTPPDATDLRNSGAIVPAETLDSIGELVGRKRNFTREFIEMATGAPTGGPNADGYYPIHNEAGFEILVPSPKRIAADAGRPLLGPEAFGAFGDDQSHTARNVFSSIDECRSVYPFARSLAQEMDFLAWQKMVNIQSSYACPPRAKYVMCNDDSESHVPLSWIAGIADVDARYSQFSWKRLRAHYDTTHMFADWNFPTPAGWTNNTSDYTPRDIIAATFDQGYASIIDSRDGSDPSVNINPFYEFYHSLTLPAGQYRLVITLEATRGQSFHHGNLNPPYYAVRLDGISSAGINGNVKIDAVDPENAWTTSTAFVDFQSSGNPGRIRVQGGGYANVRIRSLDIQPYLSNCAIHNLRDGALDHFFMPSRLRRATILGPDSEDAAAGTTCGLWKSFVDIDGNLQDWQEVQAWDFSTAIECGSGAYLQNYVDCNFVARSRGLYFPLGNANAGENIKFINGAISGSGGNTFVNPGGAEITLQNTITDYAVGWCKDNAGTIRMIGSHHEQKIPPTADQPIWHCIGSGRVIYNCCELLMAGGVKTSPTPMAHLDTCLNTLEFHMCNLYNLSSLEGVIATGAGRVIITNLQNPGNANLGGDLLTTAAASDVLGGAGLFSEPYHDDIYLLNRDTSDIRFEGGLISTDPAGMMLDRWNHDLFNIDVATDAAWPGKVPANNRSCRVRKIGKDDNSVDNQIQFLIPMRHRGHILGRMFFLFPNPIEDQKYADPIAYPFGASLFFRCAWVNVIGHDVLGRPIVTQRGKFNSEKTIDVPAAGSSTWVKRTFGTMYQGANDNPDDSGLSPEWATHLAILIDAQSIPAMTFYIDGLQANILG